MKLLYRCLLLIGVMTSLSLHACAFAVVPPMYSAEAIEAWVVDEDTGQPLEGVIVAAHWELVGSFEGSAVGQMMVMETVTDATGRFFFPAWGPKLRPLEGHLDNADPRLLLFKSDYTALWLVNEVRTKINHSAVRRSVWNGQTIKLKKFEGSLEDYARHLGFFDNRLVFAFRDQDCSWKHIPHMLVAMHLEEKRFHEKGIPTYRTPILDREERAEWAEPSKCGSVREFLRSYLP